MTLDDIIRQFKSIPYLFIGSGLSRRYLNTPNWEELMKHLADKVDDKLFSRERRKEEYENRPSSEFYMELAGKLRAIYDEKFDSEDAFLKEEFANHVLKREHSILKQYISLLFRQEEYPQNLAPDLQEELKLLSSLGKRSIAAVITTNYDHLTRILFPDFAEYVGQQDMLFTPLMGIQEVYKIHGSAGKPESIIITKKDYDQFKEKQAYLAAKLMTIFMEHPIVFLGYSLKDPNILSILKSIAYCLTEKQVERIKNHLLFIEYSADKSPTPVVADKELLFHYGTSEKNLKLKSVTLHSFKPLFESLSHKTFCYAPKVLAQLKRDIYQLVSSNAPTARFRLPSESDGNDILINGVTLMPVGSGFSRLESDDIYRCIFDETSTRPPEMIRANIGNIFRDQLPPIYSHCSQLLPLCRYLHLYIEQGYSIDDVHPNLLNYIRELDKSKFMPAKNLLTKLRGLKTWNEVTGAIRLPAAKCQGRDLGAIYQINPADINLDDLKAYILQLLREPECQRLYTELRKLIRYYDFLYYKKRLPDLP